MCRTQFSSTLVVISLFSFSISPSFAEQGDAAKAQASFDAAMKADAAGESQARDRLLKAALEADPTFELARWHLGQVLFRGYWRSLETVQSIVEHDPRWNEYQELLEQSGNTLEDHAVLARWCRRNRLENEEEQHWQQVLQMEPEHKQALNFLGKKPYQGGYFTPEEIADLKRRERQARLSFQKHQKALKRLVAKARQGDEQVRSEILSDIASLNDSAAVDALFDLVVKTCGGNGSTTEVSLESFEMEVCGAVISALEKNPYQPATLRLLDIAVFAPQGEIRSQAALALRYRQLTSFMPLLMESLAAPIESMYSFSVGPTGRVNVVEETYEEGRYEANRLVQTSSFLEETYRITFRRTGAIADFTHHSNPALASNSAANQIVGTQTRVHNENAIRRAGNARIIDVLRIVTDKDLGDDPKTWWDDWNQFNELYTPEELPVNTVSVTNFQTPRIAYRFMPMSCFLAGTPVWTQAGMVPIEEIEAGDLVLSQDPLSGKLGYRTVIGTTLRPPTEMVSLHIDGETITTTLGHRFWLSDYGWRMAKFLNKGNQLFSVQGSKKLETIEKHKDTEAHNLIVDGYHTYFVGRSRLLVHDNSMPAPNNNILPGVEADSGAIAFE